MLSTPVIWNSGARKEAFELLTKLWSQGDARVRARLTTALTAGPPEELDSQKSPEERQASRDRRIFDRIAVLLRDTNTPLTSELSLLHEDILQRHPQWRLAEGEQANFAMWMEVGWSSGTSHSVESLAAIQSISEIVDRLTNEQNDREDLLDAWRNLVGNDTDRGLAVLEFLTKSPDRGSPEVWRATLWGFREGAKNEELRQKLVAMLSIAPDPLFFELEFSRAVSDLLEGGLSQHKEPPTDAFWNLFDRTLRGIEQDSSNGDEPENGQWVNLALNRSLGHLATAFLNMLFNYRLKTGDRIPPEQRERLASIVAVGKRNHRPARVIAASRLPYLFAVDPGWSRETLIFHMNWQDEDEALALWQGFLWQPRVGTDLWAELRDPFFAAFTTERLKKLGDAKRTMAQLLMLTGVEFPSEEVPSERARLAIKAMTSEMREEAIWWLWSFLAQTSGESDMPDDARADSLWHDRVQPWLQRVWPREQSYRTAELSERFAILVAATSTKFSEAVDFVMPFLLKTDSHLLLNSIAKSDHPSQHPQATLRLLEATVNPNSFFMTDELTDVLNRMSDASPSLRNQPTFRLFDDKLRALRQ